MFSDPLGKVLSDEYVGATEEFGLSQDCLFILMEDNYQSEARREPKGGQVICLVLNDIDWSRLHRPQ